MTEVPKGKFTIPGLVTIKTRKKAATKATTRLMFGKMQKVKAKPAKTVVKAFCVKALKDAETSKCTAHADMVTLAHTPT